MLAVNKGIFEPQNVVIVVFVKLAVQLFPYQFVGTEEE